MYQFLLKQHCGKMTLNLVDFDPMDEIEDDYKLDDFLPKTIGYRLQPLIEYRIKLILKESTLFRKGESRVVNTTCMMKSKMKYKHGKNIAMHLLAYEKLPLSFASEGQVDRQYSGRVVVKLTNYSDENKRLYSGTPVGYIVLQPFSLE